MNRIIAAAAMAGIVTIVGTGRARAQSKEPPAPTIPSMSSQQMQASHTVEARKLCQKAIEAAKMGKTDSLVEHAEHALTEAQAAQKEAPSPALDEAVKSLQVAV